MKMRKRSCSLLALALAFAMVLGLLCSCGTASAANPPATTAVVAEPSETQNDVAPPEAELAGHVVEGTDENQDTEYGWKSPDERDDDGGGESKGDGEDEPQMDAPGAHGYRYEVDEGVVIYTDHDLYGWIEPDNSHSVPVEAFVLEDMFSELFGCTVRKGLEVSLDFFRDGEAIGGLVLDTPHPDNGALFQNATIFLRCDGVDYKTGVTIRYCSSSVEDFYTVIGSESGGYRKAIPRELAPLILLAAERMAEEPQNGALNGYDLGDNFITY